MKPTAEPYRPPSVEAFGFFIDIMCDRCHHLVACDVITRAIRRNIEDPGYPDQFQRINGIPCCTDFKTMEAP